MKKYGVAAGILATIIAVSVFIFSCMARKGEPIRQKQFVPESQHVVNGEMVFMAHCQKCHPGGESGLAPAINSNPAPQFIKRFQMRHGLGVMPSFKKDEISKKDLHDVSKFLKAWKRY
jgi:mono/diheme cytochrome c family protein